MSRLYVGNLPNETREDDLRRTFSEKAQIRDVTLKNGFAFIEYNDADTADMVRRDLDGSEFNGKQLRIDIAKPKPSSSDRGDRRGGYDSYEDRRGGYPPSDRFDDRRGGYDDRRGGYEDRRGGGGYAGGYDRPAFDDRRGGYDDRRGGYDDRRGGYDRPRYDDRPRGGYDRPRGSRHPPPHSTEFGLIIDGLPRGLDWRDLKDHFRSVGTVCYTKINEQGQGVVQYETEEVLLLALKTFDGSVFKGTTITVSRAPSMRASSSNAPDAGVQRSPSPPRGHDSPNGH